MTLCLEKIIEFKKGYDDIAIKNLRKILYGYGDIKKTFKGLSAKRKLQFIGILHLYQHEIDEDGNITSRLFTYDINKDFGFNEEYLVKHYYHYLRFIKRKRKNIWIHFIDNDGKEYHRCVGLQ